MNEERTGKCLRQVEHIRGHLWHRYSITINQVMVATVNVMTTTLPKGTFGSVASLLAATLYQGNPDIVFTLVRTLRNNLFSDAQLHLRLWRRWYCDVTVNVTMLIKYKGDFRLLAMHWIDTSAGGLLVPEGIIRPVVHVFALTKFIRYIYCWNLHSWIM